MPAEWEMHSGTQLHWPHNRETWPGERLEKVEDVYAHIIEVLTQYEHVHLFVANEYIQQRARTYLNKRDINDEQLTFHQTKINDVWARDCGPIFVKDGNGYVITNWIYNAWGEKYPPWSDDDELPVYVSDYLGIPRVDPAMVLEGGSIDTNGKGLFLTTESVLLNPNRNPSFSKADIERKLKNFLGAEHIIWLGKGLVGDDTDGHVDDLTRFLNENTVLTMISEDPEDVNAEVLQKNLEILKSVRLKDGLSLNIETLPLPKTKIEGTTVDGSSHVPASYANFYIANGVVLVPLYDERYDQQALDLFARYFSDRDVIGIPCTDLVWGQGSIHCITQQWYTGRVNTFPEII